MVRTALLLGLLLAGCDQDPCARGSMLESEGGLVLTEAEHPSGWGLTTCTDCHALASLHRVGCTAGVDLDAVTTKVEEDGLSSCAECHGDNGVAADTGESP